MESARLPRIFDYSDPQSYLRDVLASKRQKNPSFSARAWAAQMGFSGHSLLMFFLTGRRQIRAAHVPKLLKGLKLSEDEARYFQALVHFASAKSTTEKEIFEGLLRQIHPEEKFSHVDLERFRLISSWLHMALLEMTQLEGFQADPAWIAKRLDGKATKHQIAEALERLQNLGLLKETEEGRLVKTHARLTTPSDRPSQAIREHHRQVLELAIESIESQSVDERVLNSCAMAIDVSKLDQAKALISEFRSKMAALMESPNAGEVYELSVQFFRLTKKESVCR
ncbi:MAG: hypothetical protein RJB38_667 [Pseudomonadota bacterium]|jgi:uncharacterized protein (TIGR02147 family)